MNTLNSLSKQSGAKQPLSIRIGVGFGHISNRIQAPVNRLSGEAFQYARQSIEKIKTNSLFKFDVLTAFKSDNELFDKTINLIYGLHDTLVLKIKRKQWEALEEFIEKPEKPALEHAARRLNLDVSTVSRTLKRAYYWQLSETAVGAGALIERTFL